MRDAIRLPRWAALVFGAAILLPQIGAAEPARFTGELSCRSAGCHGGGVGKNQCSIWEKKDAHARAQAILSNARSQRVGQALGMTDPSKEGRCTVCHSPFESISGSRFVGDIKPEQGVSCETCHGPAEGWIRFHTRLDLSREQRLSAGMREMKDLYHRANTCVACHLYIDPEYVEAGHPEMYFELAAQMKNEPPHWKVEADPWLDERAWQIGQAAALREISWKAGSNPDEDLQARMKGLLWLLRLSSAGQSELPASGDAHTVQAAADRLAKSAGNKNWTKEGTLAQFRHFAESSEAFRDAAVPAPEQRRRAEVLTIAMDRFWQSLKTAGYASPTLETAFGIAQGEAKTQANFQPARFAAALQQVEVALVEIKQGPPAAETKDKNKEKKE